MKLCCLFVCFLCLGLGEKILGMLFKWKERVYVVCSLKLMIVSLLKNVDEN